MKARDSRCHASAQLSPSRQRGSALLLALIFLAVLARMALSAVDAALLGSSLAFNYRNHDRLFHGAEALLVAVDASLLSDIKSRGLQVTLDTLPTGLTEVEMPLWVREEAGVEVLHYQVYPGDTTFDALSPMSSASTLCGLLYQLDVQADGVRPGTHIRLKLRRGACCANSQACEAGDFVSLSRDWRRLE